MRRSGFKKRIGKPLKRTRIRVVGKSTTADDKKEIQRLVREIVILRDGGCIFKKNKGHVCSGYTKNGELILQADHLLSRGNSATFADTRLIVCVCKGIHGWKSVGSNLRKKEYDEMVRKLISKERMALWDRCEADTRGHKTRKMDWKLEILALRKELSTLEANNK